MYFIHYSYRLFQAQMKLDRRISATKRKEIIDELLQDIGLARCKNNYIGSSSFGTDKVIRK